MLDLNSCKTTLNHAVRILTAVRHVKITKNNLKTSNARVVCTCKKLAKLLYKKLKVQCAFFGIFEYRSIIRTMRAFQVNIRGFLAFHLRKLYVLLTLAKNFVRNSRYLNFDVELKIINILLL